MIGIVTVSLIPLRKIDSECSEMTSQLLFGECVEILQYKNNWLQVRNLSDGYVGWIDKKMLRLLQNSDSIKLKKSFSSCITIPVIECINSLGTFYLPGGSLLPIGSEYSFMIDNQKFSIEDPACFLTERSGLQIIELAKQYLNAPYLWGGKTYMGIDCSGLVQVVYRMVDIQLPRDASMQVCCGQVVRSLQEVQPGDLAFFSNDNGKVTHVGILLDSHKIIHASGCVKIESIDSSGILSSETGEYSHILHSIRRLI